MEHVSGEELQEPKRSALFVKQLVFVFNPCFVLCGAVIGHTTIDLNILPETQPASEVQYGPV